MTGHRHNYRLWTLPWPRAAMVLALCLTACGSHYKPTQSPAINTGDINNDGIGYTLSDINAFMEYFLIGSLAFPTGMESTSIAASDVNGDGTALSVADLVYMIRVARGIAEPSPDPPPRPIRAGYRYDGSTVTIDSEMGAAAFVFDGNVSVELLAAGMEFWYFFDGRVTRAVLYSLDGTTLSGSVVRGERLISVEFGSVDGALVVARRID